ncbi:uncharacterized protein LOC133295881 isoform X2 [Gastrolobium bilobum]|uniref:uncharacterized protein LOC133295881 isoform X2 n=1 Tax=Gastrolobium bilobum TaxID=150636 RepID=UPI002AB02E6F|nr:uncharacterized protein LOC133295881 isoform X2 [Gastrolobium bilobum]
MAFDQNSVPKDLRPLNVTPAMAEEPLISPATTTPPSPNDPFYLPSASDGFVYGNMGSSLAATWCVCPGPIGFNYGSSFGNRVATGNALDSGNWVGANNGLDKVTVNGYAYGGAFRGNRVVGNVSDPTPSPSHRGDDAGGDSVSGKRVKFLCSFGGKILPRPSDGMLRYVGGQTRIISVGKDVSFNDLVQKMVNACGQPVVIKYQLPEEDLDSLVSVSCPDDVENMMEEYEKLIERSPDGSAKLRVFLFSASELELSGGGQSGDSKDSGQKYFDAVNGIADGNGIIGGITKKESIASAASTQNSDLSGTETLDSLIAGQGDVSGMPVSCVLSPKETVAASPDTTANLVALEPSAAVYSGASAVSVGTPVANSPTYTAYFQNEVELEKSVPITLSQQPFGLQQSGIEIQSPSPYLQPFVDPRQEVMNHVDYVHLPPQMGFPNPQLLGKTGPVFTQQQFHDNTPGLAFHQVIPGVQMTTTQPSSYVGVRPNVIQPQPLMQPQQNRLDQYNNENTSGIRIIQLPAERSYNSYQVPVSQVPSVIVGGNYGWVQVPPQEHVVFSDGLLPKQQVMIPEKIQRTEDCSMCQTKLPHAHSDPVVPDQHSSGEGPIPDSTPTYHSFPMEDNSKAQATNRVMVTAAPLKEGVVEQGAGTRPRVVSKLEPPDEVPFTDTIGLSHNRERQPEGGRIFIQKPDGFGHPRDSYIQQMIGRAGGKQSSSDDLMGTAPLSYLDDVVHQQHMVSVENWVKQDVLVHKPVNNDIRIVERIDKQTSECVIQGSPKEHTNELTGVVSKSDAVVNWISQDHLKTIDGRMDILKIRNPEGNVSNDHYLLPVDKPSGNDKIDYNTQQAVEEEVILDKNFGRPKLLVDTNQIKMTGVTPCSSMEISYGHNAWPREYNEVAQPSVWGIPGSNPQSKSGNSRKDDAASSSISPSARFGDMQDSPNSLFSNQDPWNIQHETFFPPARASNAASKKDTCSYKDHFGENPGNCGEQNLEAQLDDDGLCGSFRQNLTLEHAQFAKGSAEDQQLQAVAEDVAASVLHPNPDLHARGVSCRENIEDGDVQNNLLNDVKSKPPEKANFGFPPSNVGGLQVIKNCDLEELTELGSGTFGTVYHGKWRGTDVAIKRITDRCFAGKPSEQERMRDDFWNEAIKLADLHHPNVVAFYGVVLDGPGGSVATVTEYMVNGSLRNALQECARNLDKRKRLLIAMDVAFGMEYLHGKNIVHFDLKSDNLLVNLRDPHRPICKVGDLGLSKVKRQTLISGGVRGTLPWMAPELLNGSSSLVSEKVDVFSFGIVMWELFTGEEPYADLHYGAIIGGIVSNTLRPPVPESCDPEWRLLMERCWSSEPSERPSFTEIANELRSIATKISSKGQQNQQLQHYSLQTQLHK